MARPRSYGYLPGGMALDEAEAALIREAVDRVLAGESMRALVADWNRRGVKTVTGARWSATTLRRLLRSGRISAQREHHDRITGPAAWPAIVDASTTWRLRAVIDDPNRPGRHAIGGSEYLLSGLLRCGACGAGLVSRPAWRNGQPIRRYHCAADRGGCNGVGIIAAPLEELVTEAVLVRLDSPALRKALSRPQKPPRNGAEKALRAAEAREGELATMWARGEISKASWSAARDGLAKEIEEARTRIAGRVTTDARAELVGKGESLRRRWAKLPVDRRRVIVRAVVEAVTIAPTTKSHNRFDPDRISVLWRA